MFSCIFPWALDSYAVRSVFHASLSVLPTVTRAHDGHNHKLSTKQVLGGSAPRPAPRNRGRDSVGGLKLTGQLRVCDVH